MADVFISYHEDSEGELAEQIADALNAAGISCWCARRDLPPGSNFARDIPPQIDACRVFLLLLNNGVYQSLHVENELGMAFERLEKDEIIILPFITEEGFTRKKWIRYYLVHIQSVKIPLSDPRRIEKLVRQIARMLVVPSRKPEERPPAENIEQSDNRCGENVVYALDDSGVLTISGVSGGGPMWDYDWDSKRPVNGAPWYRDKDAIVKVRIQGNVTSIGVRAFKRCNQLLSVAIPDSVTSIGDFAFYACARLTGVTIPGSVTSIGNFAFYDCHSLTSVAIPEGVTSIGWDAFQNCESLTDIQIPDSVTFIGRDAFCGCEGLKGRRISIPAKTRLGDNAFPKTVTVTRRE